MYSHPIHTEGHNYSVFLFLVHTHITTIQIYSCKPTLSVTLNHVITTNLEHQRYLLFICGIIQSHWIIVWVYFWFHG